VLAVGEPVVVVMGVGVSVGTQPGCCALPPHAGLLGALLGVFAALIGSGAIFTVEKAGPLTADAVLTNGPTGRRTANKSRGRRKKEMGFISLSSL
jgi:hypothetical protein